MGCASVEGGAKGCTVVFAAFSIQVLTFGTSQAIGIYYIEFLRYFHEGAAAVSLVGAINFGIFLGAGPLASMLMARWGHRQVALVGSALANIGLICMPFAPNLQTMYICYGVLTGLGNCLVHMSSNVLNGTYFCRHRSIATGIASSGSGMGAIVLPLVMYVVIEHYGWQGSLFIIAGLNLHLFIFAALLFPVPEKTQRALEEQERLKEIEESLQHNSTDSPALDNTNATNGGVNTDINIRFRTKRFDSITVTNVIEFGDKPDTNGVTDSALKFNHTLTSHTGKLLWVTHNSKSMDQTFVEQTSIMGNSLPNGGELSEKFKDSSVTETNDTNANNHVIDLPHCVTQTESDGELYHHVSTRDTLRKHINSVCTTDFIIYMASNTFWCAGMVTFMQFVPEFAISIGLEKDQASFVLTVLGIGNTIGSVLGGLLGNIKYINRITLYIIANVGAGSVALLSIPEMTHSLSGLMTVCVFYGLLLGIVQGLMLVVTSDLLGIEALGAGFGYLMLANGVGVFGGPPIAGLLIDHYGSIDPAMYVVGIVSILGGLIMGLVPIRRFLNMAVSYHVSTGPPRMPNDTSVDSVKHDLGHAYMDKLHELNETNCVKQDRLGNQDINKYETTHF